jgi:hypothetical protein
VLVCGQELCGFARHDCVVPEPHECLVPDTEWLQGMVAGFGGICNGLPVYRDQVLNLSDAYVGRNTEHS